MTDPTPSPVRDAIVRASHDMPDLIARAREADPDLWKSLTGSAFLTSKGVWGPVLTAGLTWLSTKYGLGWDDPAVGEVSLAISLVASLAAGALIRVFGTKGPITSVLPPAAPETPPHA